MNHVTIDVKLLYQTVQPEELAGSLCVVIDILRATTSIVHALGHGAKLVSPCETIEQTALKLNHYAQDNVLRGGERHGVTIQGFELDNSPWSYTSSNIQGKVILFTTTNGTQAISRCRLAKEVLIGAFSNYSAMLEALSSAQLPIHLVCAGTDGKLSLEDILFAGMLVQDLQKRTPNMIVIRDDETTLALALAASTSTLETERLELFKLSRGGRNLLELNMQRDLERAAKLDLYEIVPIWSSSTGEITVYWHHRNDI